MSASGSRSGVVLQLAEEFLERYRQGQRPSLKEYIDRHPELAAEIKEVFPAMALMENVALDSESLAGVATGPATVSGAAPPEQLGDYRILREVGRGGMGIVYEAEQVSLGRHVALKVLPRKVLLDDAQKRRFEREAKAAAKLHHTNIVPVFGVGEQDGLPYYVMQFIQGLGLDDVLDELKRMQGDSTPATGGALRVARKDVSAADVARSLLTGAFQDGEPAASAAGLLHPAADAAGSPESSGKLSDSYTVTSAVKLPSSHVKGKKATYWQSVANIGVQVAEALEYAHKQGIQHRDIKPSNLLLDTAGTVWVTDFGLARADNEDHLTQTGDIVGTLRYMPPEAFEGRADKRGDIYSLGLTLYELLARQPAFEERDRHRLIKRVTTEEPSRLDKSERSIPRDLVTIVHKAIDREPSHRYHTAGELSADLRRFLDDEPIQARRISHRERFLRWCRHHPGVATLTATLAVILLGVTVVSLMAAARFDRAAENERQARRAADDAKDHEAGLRKQAEEAQKQAESNLGEAEKQKQRAEANFAKAREAVDVSFTAISESQLKELPGMQPLRRDLLQSALTFYQDFLKQRSDDPALRGDVAAAFLRLGNIRGELGEYDKARHAYEQARELYEALTKAAPASAKWRHGLAQCYEWLRRHDEAIALWEKLVQPGQPRYQKELASSYNSRGHNHSDAGRFAEALQAHQQALDIRAMLVRLDPDDADAQRDLGGTLNNIGFVLERIGRRAEALAMYRRAAEHAEASFAQAPQVLLNGHFLAIEQNNIARMEDHLGHEKEAMAAYRRAVEVRRKMARDNPAVPDMQAGVAQAYFNLEYYQRHLKQTEEAARTMRQVRETIERMPSDSPADMYRVAIWWAACLPSPDPKKDKPTAEELAEQKRDADLAMEALRQAVAAGFRNLAALRNNLNLKKLKDRDDFKAVEADLSARVNNSWSGGLKARQDALALHQKLAQADPKNKRLQAVWAASQHALASIQFDLGNVEEAEKTLEQAVALQEKLVQEEPNNKLYQTELAASRLWLHLARARRFLARKRSKEAKTELAQIDAFKPNTAALWLERGRICLELDQWDKARQDYQQAIRLNPSADAVNWFYYGYALLRSGGQAGYRQACRDMLYRFGQGNDVGGLSWTVRTCILDAGAVADPSQAVQAARKVVKAFPGRPSMIFAVAAAHYRAGQFDEAIQQSEEVLRANDRPDGDDRVLAWLVLAMAHQRKGRPQDARTWLQQAVQWFDDDSEGQPRAKTTWRNWLIARQLRREAEALLDPKIAEANRRAEAAGQQTLPLQPKSAQADPEIKRLQADLAACQHSIALVQIGLGKPDEARKYLQQAIALREALVKDEPNNSQYQADRAASRFALGDIHWQFGRLTEGAKTWQRELDALEAAAPQGQKRSVLADQLVALRRMIAYQYARVGLWKEAAGHSDRLLQRVAADDDYWKAAVLALRAGDLVDYRRICGQWFQQVGDSDLLSRHYILSRVCGLADNSGINPLQTIQEAGKGTGRNPPTEWFRAHVLGLAHYRAGQFAEAITLASQSDTLARDYHAHILNYPVLAMAHHRLGQDAPARDWLDKTRAEWRRLSPLQEMISSPTVLPLVPKVTWDLNWPDWPMFEILFREASVLIAGAPPLEDAFDRAHQSLLYIRLGESDKAEAQWQAAVKMAPKEPALWLARGRVFAQLGQHDKADADFAKARTLIEGQKK